MTEMQQYVPLKRKDSEFYECYFWYTEYITLEKKQKWLGDFLVVQKATTSEGIPSYWSSTYTEIP